MPKVLITDGVFESHDIERSVLEPLGVELVEASAPDSETLAREAAGVDAVMVCFAPVDRSVVDAAGSDCRIIARYGIGIDNIAVGRATDLGIQVTNVPDYCLDEVADHALALLLAHARQVVSASRSVARDGWQIDHAAVHRVGGRRLALIGLGAIGRRVASRAQAFGIEVVAFDPFLDPDRAPAGVRITSSLADAVADADFVSVHAPMTDENHHLIDSEAIAAMTRAPLLINTARGGLVDLDAVLDALESGALGGAALDVTEPEPLPEGHPLREHPRAIVTPHMAFHSVEATEELQRRTAEEVARAFRGESPDCPVNTVDRR